MLSLITILRAGLQAFNLHSAMLLNHLDVSIHPSEN